MSDFKVPLTQILKVEDLKNSDRLSICTVYGYQVVTQRNKYSVGDIVIYCPIDSILPKALEELLFPADSKVKLTNSRIRQIRLRGQASQGMLIDPSDVAHLVNIDYATLETDLSSVLNIKKYEPSVKGPGQTIGKIKDRNRYEDNKNFHAYNGVENIKWFPTLFAEGEEVTVQCKLHGTNARAGVLPHNPNTLWKRIKKYFGLAPKYDNVYGSNNVQISYRTNYVGYYQEDLYGKAFRKIDVWNKLKPGETVYGEIIGEGIQNNYHYGHKEPHFVLFDVKKLQEDGTQIWLSPNEVEQFAKERGFDFVPVLYKGPFNKEFIYTLTKGPSIYYPAHKVREGVVIKAAKDYCVNGNKKALKWINEQYLDDTSNSDEH